MRGKSTEPTNKKKSTAAVNGRQQQHQQATSRSSSLPSSAAPTTSGSGVQTEKDATVADDSNSSSSSKTSEKHFDRFDQASVRVFAEAQGFTSRSVHSSGWQALTEDLNFRLRTVTNLAVKFCKHSKRSKLTCADIDRALIEFGQQTLRGHSQLDQPKVHSLKELRLFARHEGVVDLESLALSSHACSVPAYPSLSLSGQILFDVKSESADALKPESTEEQL